MTNDYPKTEMIEIKKSYVVELTEQQAKELYLILKNQKDIGHLNTDYELVLVYNELKQLFESGKYNL